MTYSNENYPLYLKKEDHINLNLDNLFSAERFKNTKISFEFSNKGKLIKELIKNKKDIKV